MSWTFLNDPFSTLTLSTNTLNFEPLKSWLMAVANKKSIKIIWHCLPLVLLPLSCESSSRGLAFGAKHGHSAQASCWLLWEDAGRTQRFPLTLASLARDPCDPSGNTTEEQRQVAIVLVVTVSPWPDLHRPIKSVSNDPQVPRVALLISHGWEPNGRNSAECRSPVCSVVRGKHATKMSKSTWLEWRGRISHGTWVLVHPGSLEGRWLVTPVW